MAAGNFRPAGPGIVMQRNLLLVLAMLATLAGNGVVSASALHNEWLDKNVDPLKDFFQYANGGFLRDNPIPPAYSSWGQFQILNQSNQDYIHELLQAAAVNKSAAPGSDEQIGRAHV